MNTKLIVSILVLIAGLLIASTAHAQMAISEEGVTFPDESEQTSAVIVPMNCPHGDSIVWDSNADSWVCETDLSPVICPCAVGETGPAGGIVFYVTAGGLHGLEAALEDQLSAPWCSSNTDIADIDNIGSAVTPDSHSGAHNTPLIVAVCGVDSAAGKASAYVWPLGQTDGFLPNKEELDLMYANLDNQNPPLGGFADDPYWSSSENNEANAWFKHFSNGVQIATNKDYTYRVRAVRAF